MMSCPFNYSLQNCLYNVRGTWDITVPPKYLLHAHGDEIIMRVDAIFYLTANRPTDDVVQV